MVNFKEATEDDAETLRLIATEAFENDLDGSCVLPTHVDTLAWHKKTIKTGMYYKIMRDDTIVGGMSLYEWIGDCYGIATLFIKPEYQHQGIGSKAIEFIEQEFDHVKKWTLETPNLSEEHHRFYERHGYQKLNMVQPYNDADYCIYTYVKYID